jgi:hypothetical protein
LPSNPLQLIVSVTRINETDNNKGRLEVGERSKYSAFATLCRTSALAIGISLIANC